MQSLKFSDIYQQLNSAQRRAVDTIDGPVMVLAGPGTGKTQVLSARIANILLKTDANPANILALTFTESAAANMRNRVVGMIGPAGYQVEISTFHSFCNLLISNNPEFFALARGSQALTDVERFIVFEDLLQTLQLEVLKPLRDPLYYTRALMKAVADLKRENVSPQRFQTLIQSEQTELDEATSATAVERLRRLLAKHAELLLVYEAYQEQLHQMRRFDFEDMVSLAVQAFQTQPILLAEYQEKYQYILVDEYQDTNTAQNRVVQLLASYWGEAANIFVVGDPQQSIFRFQGASLENVRSFIRLFPEAEVITLDIGYRCTQAIYDSAHSFITTNNGRSHHAATSTSHQSDLTKQDEVLNLLPDKPLESVHGVGKPVMTVEVPSTSLELLLVAEQIRKLLDEGVPATDIAVLYRTNSESLALMEAMDAFGISYDVEGGGNVLDLEPIRQFLQLLKTIIVVRDHADETYLFEVLCYSWTNIPPVTVMQAVRRASQHRQSLIEYLSVAHQGQPDLSSQLLTDFIANIERWGTDDFSHTLPEFFVQVLEESGFLDWVKEQPNKVQLLLGLQALFSQVKALARARRGSKAADLLQSLDTIELAGQAITAQDETVEGSGVKLCTVHKAKGQEWRYVFITGLLDGRWGNRHHRELLPLPSGVLEYDTTPADQLAEERRLLYVAMTRAKESVLLSYAASDTTNGSSKSVVPSQFVIELQAQDGVVVSQASPETTGDQLLERLIVTTGRSLNLQSEERQYIQSLVDSMALSVSSLNKYLYDPADFLYETVLRIPSAKPAHMAFGTAIHSSLEALYQPLKDGRAVASVDQILGVFQAALKRELLVDADFERWQKEGNQLLKNYYQHLPAELPQVFSLETNFGRPPYFTYLDDIRLTGKIDRMDWIDQSQRTMRVIDYKTGAPRSLNDILGATKTAQERLSLREQTLPESIRSGYKRQLVFYQLLSELATGFPGKVVSSRFEFVQPGKDTAPPVIREMTITPEEVLELKKLIQEVMAEIRSLSFLDHLEGW